MFIVQGHLATSISLINHSTNQSMRSDMGVGQVMTAILRFAIQRSKNICDQYLISYAKSANSLKEVYTVQLL